MTLTFRIEPAAGATAPAGLIARGADRALLFRKLQARADHYAHLALAAGDDWLAVFAQTREQDTALPWLPGSPLLFYRFCPDGYCQAGYRPNLPASCHPALVRRLQAQLGLPGALALAADPPQVYDLGRSCPVAEADLARLA